MQAGAAQDALKAGAPIYEAIDVSGELRQGEIISNLVQMVQGADALHPMQHTFCIVVAQDCDLLQDFSQRSRGERGTLNGVLLLEARPAAEVRQNIGGSDIWKRVRQNKDERYHSLEGANADIDAVQQGFSALVMDFKRIFTLSADEIHRQCEVDNAAQRRCLLTQSYRDHLQLRFAFYIQRIAIPRPHEVTL